MNVDMCEILLITSESTDYEFPGSIWDACVCLVMYLGTNSKEEGLLKTALIMGKVP